MNMNPQPSPIVIDTESTGLFPGHYGERDEMLEIAIVETNGTILLDSLVKPVTKAEWPDAMEINHITPEMVADAPYLTQLADQIRQAVQGRIVYIWNADYDMRLLGFLLDGAAMVICAMKEFGEYISEKHPASISRSGRYKLEKTAHDLGVDIEGKPHRALTDVFTTIHVMEAWKSGKFDDADLSGNVDTPPYITQPADQV